jgi:tetratricopeptide (TPR) repeat protein
MAIFSTFNPSTLPSTLVEGAFVQRERMASRLVDIFEDGARRESKHNVLLVGPRGIGKSHLVSLVYHRLKAKTDLADKLCIAYLREDEWGVASFLDLMLRISRVAREESGLASSDDIGNLSKLGRSQAEDQVWRSLREVLGNRTLLVIVENLDVVFEKIGEQGQKQWRALMQTDPRWAILATTPSLFSGISRQVSPFYGFFEVVHLQPLSFDDAIALLRKLAHLSNDDKTEDFLDSAVGRARVRAIQHIAGGNHRIFVLFYDFLSQSGSEQFVEPLLKTIDALTPYYQSQMAGLSPQQQKIVNFLCEHRKPATVTTIAAHCFTTNQTASSQLRQLLIQRYVRVDRVGRQSFYELTEPLLRICVEAKTHRERPLYLLVDFLRYWFSREELERKMTESDDPLPGKSYFLAALKEYDEQDAHVHLAPEIAPLCRALTQGKGRPEELQAQAQELAELSLIAEDWPHYTRALIWLKKSAAAIPILERKIEQGNYDVDLLRALAFAYANLENGAGSTERGLLFIDRAIRLTPNSGTLLFDKGEFLASLGRNAEAVDAYDQAVMFDADLKPIVAVEKARALNRLEKFREARETLRPFLAHGETIPGVFYVYGATRANEGKAAEALEYFDKAAQAFENDPLAWRSKGVALSKLGRYREAIDSLQKSLSLEPNNNLSLYYLGEAFLETKQYAAAVETLPLEDLSHNIFHQLLGIWNSHVKQGRLQQRLLAIQRAHDSESWRTAFASGLIEFAGFAVNQKDAQGLEVWNAALGELFSQGERFSILLKIFDVLTRVKVFNDRKALLELPREQRLLLLGNRNEEDFLNMGSVGAGESL